MTGCADRLEQIPQRAGIAILITGIQGACTEAVNRARRTRSRGLHKDLAWFLLSLAWTPPMKEGEIAFAPAALPGKRKGEEAIQCD